MLNHLNNWREKENKLAERRKQMCDRGMTAEQAISETAEEQARNNRLYNQVWKKAQYSRTVCGLV